VSLLSSSVSAAGGSTTTAGAGLDGTVVAAVVGAAVVGGDVTTVVGGVGDGVVEAVLEPWPSLQATADSVTAASARDVPAMARRDVERARWVRRMRRDISALLPGPPVADPGSTLRPPSEAALMSA
jgi:hypothetical protein